MPFAVTGGPGGEAGSGQGERLSLGLTESCGVSAITRKSRGPGRNRVRLHQRSCWLRAEKGPSVEGVRAQAGEHSAIQGNEGEGFGKEGLGTSVECC